MAKDQTVKVRIEAEENLSSAARKASSSTDTLDAQLKALGLDAAAVGRIMEEFSKGLQEGAKQAEKTADSVEGVGDAAKNAKSGLSGFIDELESRFVITAGDVANAVGSITKALTDSVGAAAENQQNIQQLNNALSDLGANSFKVSRALLDQASAIQETTRFSDDAIIQGQALAAAFIKTEEGLKRVTQAAIDLASGRGIELSTAFDLLTKASQGSTETLSRYGIILDETIPKGERFEAVLKLIGERFGGRAVADAQTYSGAITRLGNAFEDLQKALGKNVVESGAVAQTIRDVTDTLLASARAAEEARTGQDTFASSVSKASDAALRGVSTLTSLAATFRDVQEARAAAAALESLATASSRLAVNAPGLLSLGDAIRKMGEAANKSATPLEQWIFRMNEARDASERFAVANETLALGIDDTTGPVIDLDETLDQLKQRFDSGQISLEQFLNAYEALKFELEEGVRAGEQQNATLRDTEAAQANTAKATRDAAKANSEYASTIDREVIPALERAGRVATQVTPTIQGVFDRSGRAIQGVVGFSQGGTRAELAGGGSRLVGRVGGTFGSQQRVAGDATYIADPLSGRIERVG